MSRRAKTTVTSSVVGGGGRTSAGGGGGHSSSSSRRITTSGSFSCRSYGGGGSRCGYGGGISSGSCGGGIGGGIYGGGISTGGYGGGFGSSCGGFGGFDGGYGVSCGGGGFGGGSFGGGSGFGLGGFGCNDGGILSNNEKVTLQGLNDRLAAYLNKVRALENENTQLETSIKEWYQTKGPIAALKDYSHYDAEIEDLNNQIVNAAVDLNKIVLNVDNTRMTIEDFKLKYETELGLRQNVESDLNGLRPLLDQLTLARSDLELEAESLKEELISLKKNHEEEIKGLQHQTTGDVNVEVNATPGYNLTEVLNNLRKEYESIIDSNRRDVEKWYEIKIAEVNQEIHSSGQDTESSNKQVTELRREYQNVEIELQSYLSTVQSLQSSLADTEGRYNIQLQQLQAVIVSVEEELAGIRCEIDNQNQEYRVLLGVKNQLEQEIAQYHHLLDEGNHDISVPREGGSGGGRVIGSGGSGSRTGGSSVHYGTGGGSVIRSGGSGSRTGGSSVHYGGSTGGRGDERGGSVIGSGGTGSRTGGSSVHYGGSTGGRRDERGGSVIGSGVSGGRTETREGGTGEGGTHGTSSSLPTKSGESYAYSRKSFD